MLKLTTVDAVAVVILTIALRFSNNICIEVAAIRSNTILVRVNDCCKQPVSDWKSSFENERALMMLSYIFQTPI